MPAGKRTIFEKAVTLNSYIYQRLGVVNLLRRFTKQKELFRPAKTQFATAFITLSRIHVQKNNLKAMFTSEEWVHSKWSLQVKEFQNLSSVLPFGIMWCGHLRSRVLLCMYFA